MNQQEIDIEEAKRQTAQDVADTLESTVKSFIAEHQTVHSNHVAEMIRQAKVEAYYAVLGCIQRDKEFALKYGAPIGRKA
jgi:predicted nucleic-acid-binding protein